MGKPPKPKPSCGLQAEIKALKAQNAELRSALDALYAAAPAADCISFHHPKRDRHATYQPCPPQLRFELAMENARVALATVEEIPE
jgi:hypothetical protein